MTYAHTYKPVITIKVMNTSLTCKTASCSFVISPAFFPSSSSSIDNHWSAFCQYRSIGIYQTFIKWVYSFLLDAFIQHNYFEICTRRLYQQFIVIYYWHSTPFCWYTEVYLLTWWGSLGYFQFGALINKAVMNSCVQQYSLYEYMLSFLLSSYQRLAGSHGRYMFNFLRNCQLVSRVATPFYISISSVWRGPIPPYPWECLV